MLRGAEDYTGSSRQLAYWGGGRYTNPLYKATANQHRSRHTRDGSSRDIEGSRERDLTLWIVLGEAKP